MTCHDSHVLLSPHFRIGVDRHSGALMQVKHPRDPHGMNWLCEPEACSWQPLGHQWGLGWITTDWDGGGQDRWQSPQHFTANDRSMTARYVTGAARVDVERHLTDETFEETYRLTNTSSKSLALHRWCLATPWNDNYPDAPTCLVRRCHVHLWCGGHITYACALRMGRQPPHLGLVLRRGCIRSYSVADRGLGWGSSNHRGTLLLNAAPAMLAPGAALDVAWSLFWHEGIEDFHEKARAFCGFVDLLADSWTAPIGSEVTIRALHPTLRQPLHMQLQDDEEPKTLVVQSDEFGSSRAHLSIRRPGDHVVKVSWAKDRSTWLRVLGIPPVCEMIRRRVRFILDHQQVDAPDDPLHGALLCYDNLCQVRLHNPTWPDQNAGRERLAMGVLLAMWTGLEREADIENAVRRYHAFVRYRLQLPDGTVLNGLNDPQQRLYNYPWVAALHLELFLALDEPAFLDDFVATCRAYYRHGGERFYCLGMPIRAGIETLRNQNRLVEADELLTRFAEHADTIIRLGTDLPPHEVNYEQTIVAPAAHIPLGLYQLTHDERYRVHLERFVPLLQAFNGRQPDHHLHGIAIRHWDGYWFGRRRLWGDTFPHHWSSLSGLVMLEWAMETGDEKLRAAGRDTLMNNLSLFAPDGRASCAFVYPELVNGEPAAVADELANDQDWALVHLLLSARIDSSFPQTHWQTSGGSRP